MILGGYVNPLDYGAIPNLQSSATINLAAFNAAFAAAYANNLPVKTDGNTYYLSDTLYLPDIQQAASQPMPLGFVWETDNTHIVCTDINKQAVLSVPISANFNSGYTHFGKLHLSYITKSANGIGFNLNNMNHSDFGEIYTSNCDAGFFGKSVFAVTWVAFRGYLARISLEFNPLAAGSAGTACTSLKGAVYSILSAHGMKFINTFYSSITAFADSSSLGASYLPAGEVPIALNIGGGSGSTYKLGCEQWQGVVVRASTGSTFATVDLGLITGPGDQWDTSVTYSNIPVGQNAIVSINPACAIELKNAGLGSTTWTNGPMTLLYVGDDSTVTHVAGYLLTTGLQSSFVQVGNNTRGYKPIGNRFNNFSPSIFSAIPLEGLVIQNVDIVLSGVGSYTITWPNTYVFVANVSAQVISNVTYDNTKYIQILSGYSTTGCTFYTNFTTAQTVRLTSIGKVA
jgi:hypothetical protein